MMNPDTTAEDGAGVRAQSPDQRSFNSTTDAAPSEAFALEPVAELDAIARRLALDGHGGDAFALVAVVHASPRLGERVVELVVTLLDERDDLELALLDHAARDVQRREALAR